MSPANRININDPTHDALSKETLRVNAAWTEADFQKMLVQRSLLPGNAFKDWEHFRTQCGVKVKRKLLTDCMRVFFENPQQAKQDHIWNLARQAQPKAKAVTGPPAAKNAAARGAAAYSTAKYNQSIAEYAKTEAARLETQEQQEMAAAITASWQAAVDDPRMTEDGFTIASRKKGKRVGEPPDDTNQVQTVQWVPSSETKEIIPVKPKRTSRTVPKIYDNPHAIDFILNVTKSLSPSQLWADSGCRKSVGGTESHRIIQALYRKLGMKPQKVEKVNHFSFGNGAPATSTITWMYPIFIVAPIKVILAVQRYLECALFYFQSI